MFECVWHFWGLALKGLRLLFFVFVILYLATTLGKPDNYDEIFFWMTVCTNSVKIYFQPGPLPEILTASHLRLTPGRIRTWKPKKLGFRTESLSFVFIKQNFEIVITNKSRYDAILLISLFSSLLWVYESHKTSHIFTNKRSSAQKTLHFLK